MISKVSPCHEFIRLGLLIFCHLDVARVDVFLMLDCFTFLLDKIVNPLPLVVDFRETLSSPIFVLPDAARLEDSFTQNIRLVFVIFLEHRPLHQDSSFLPFFRLKCSFPHALLDCKDVSGRSFRILATM